MSSTAPYYQSINHGSWSHSGPQSTLGNGNRPEFRAHQDSPLRDLQHDTTSGAEAEMEQQVDAAHDGRTSDSQVLARLLEAVNSNSAQHDGMVSEHGNGEQYTGHQLASTGMRKRSADDKYGSKSPKRCRPTIAEECTTPLNPAAPRVANNARVQGAVTFRSSSNPAASTSHDASPNGNGTGTVTAKKYTRPPMSSLYASLHLSPESFLHLQAAAKAFMLDPRFPDRQDCVGVRGQTSVDMAKLRLFGTVKEFLEDGVGERFFPSSGAGNAAVDGAQGVGGKYVWPRDGEAIIGLVTPLMRRMVTNERQRMYAAESRKEGSAKKGKARSEEVEDAGRSLQLHLELDQRNLDSLLPPVGPDQSSPTQTPTPTPTSSRPQSSSAPVATKHAPPSTPSKRTGAAATESYRLPSTSPIPPPRCSQDVIQFVFMRGQAKLLRFDWPNDPGFGPMHSHMTFAKLVDTVTQHVGGIRARDVGASCFAAAPSNDACAPSLATAGGAADMEEEPGELLRRELQSLGESHATCSSLLLRDAMQMQIAKPFEDLGVTVSALTIFGLMGVENEVKWDQVKQQVSQTIWLEGCLRVVVSLLDFDGEVGR